MFSLRDLRFLLYSLHVDVVRAQRIMDFFNLKQQINEVGKSDHMEAIVLWITLPPNPCSSTQC